MKPVCYSWWICRAPPCKMHNFAALIMGIANEFSETYYWIPYCDFLRSNHLNRENVNRFSFTLYWWLRETIVYWQEQPHDPVLERKYLPLIDWADWLAKKHPGPLVLLIKGTQEASCHWSSIVRLLDKRLSELEPWGHVHPGWFYQVINCLAIACGFNPYVIQCPFSCKKWMRAMWLNASPDIGQGSIQT